MGNVRYFFGVFSSVVFAWTAGVSRANLDFYVNAAEMKRLRNVEGELWYVENGRVNENAVEYEFEILPDVEALYFSWLNRGDNPISYTADIAYEPETNLQLPTATGLSIPSKGQIQSVTSFLAENPSVNENIFMVYLPRCSPSINGDVRARLRFSFRKHSSQKNGAIFVELRRYKNCTIFKEELSRKNEADFEEENDEDFEEKIGGFRSFFHSARNLFYVACGCLFGVSIVTASMIILYFVKADRGHCCSAKPSEKREECEDAESTLLSPRTILVSTPINSNFSRDFNRENSRQKRDSNSPSIVRFSTEKNIMEEGKNEDRRPGNNGVARVLFYSESKPVEVEEALRHLSVDRSAIEVHDSIMEGTFGEVFTGSMKNAMKEGVDDEEKEIIVKTNKEKVEKDQLTIFLAESLRFFGMSSHVNVCLPAAVTRLEPTEKEKETGGENAENVVVVLPRFLVCYEHDGYGNLKKFLIRCRGGEGANGAPVTLSTQDLVYAALQIIRGLLHLHKCCVLHKDVAARNCIVGHDLHIQICDTGLSRDLFPHDYHCLCDNGNRPVKWLSPESLERAEFSTASDVWAFGVTLWELTTLAQQPYSDVDPFEMHSYLSADKRLTQPYNCPDELYLLMYCCWNMHAEARPTFGQLLSALEHFYAQLTQYI